MKIPRATYRLQLHSGFTFDHAATVVPYLARLGISHVYTSPITQARPGSTHGYDIVDHGQINSELGGEDGFARFSDVLKEHGLGLVLDIVPNHMGVGGADNPYWLSVLEWGELSPFGDMFDVDWDRLGAGGKLVVPFLGSRYGLALEAGELQLRFDADEGSFSVWHWENRFPIHPPHYAGILDRALAALGEIEAGSELLTIAEAIRTLAADETADRRAALPEEIEKLKARLAEAARDTGTREAIERAVSIINGTPDHPDSFGTLHRLLDEQVYRLAHWRVAASDINYRRFFDINTLGGIRVENRRVFEQTHELIFRLIREGRVHGLRIDHIDGLADPAGYANALQQEIGPDFYIVVEKILEPGEKLRPWPVAGTTGYDILNVLDGIFVKTSNARRFDTIWRDTTEIEAGYGTQLRAAKREIVQSSFASELEVLVSDLKRLADRDRATRDFTSVALRRALVDIIERFPVYRTYITGDNIDPADRELVERSVRQAKRWSSLPDRSVHDFIKDALLGGVDTSAPGTPEPTEIDRFRRRFQQLTGPVMAKSLEDTLFYRFVRLLSLNEVGGDPDHFGIRTENFHAANAERAAHWPNAMTATSTHDTKRGEDSRARLNALSNHPDRWAAAVAAWEAFAADHLTDIEGENAPDANDRFMIIQGMIGAWPLDQIERLSDATDFCERIKKWTVKALRESKRQTSWTNENADYEAAALRLVDAALAPGSSFIEQIRPLVRDLSFAGVQISLARTALKCTVPGIPDFYQGTEFWDFSLVDPDNRRPVDFEKSGRHLTDAPLADLLSDWETGRIKQNIVAALLHHRAANPALYSRGDYQALAASGARADDIVAFTRSFESSRIGVIVSRTALDPRTASDLDTTCLPLPAGEWTNVLTGAALTSSGIPIPVASLLSALPFAVLSSALKQRVPGGR